MAQRWRDACFVHWAVDPADVAPLLPPGVRPDLHDGAAWVGLVPFRMVDGALGRGPAVPYLGRFVELNVRTYSVDPQGRHGVVFLSLDAERLAVVAGARAAFATPYHWARMSYAERPDPAGAVITYRSERIGSRRSRSRMALRVGEEIEPDDLELFLTARFGLHTHPVGGADAVGPEHPRAVAAATGRAPRPLRRARHGRGAGPGPGAPASGQRPVLRRGADGVRAPPARELRPDEAARAARSNSVSAGAAAAGPRACARWPRDARADRRSRAR